MAPQSCLECVRACVRPFYEHMCPLGFTVSTTCTLYFKYLIQLTTRHLFDPLFQFSIKPPLSHFFLPFFFLSSFSSFFTQHHSTTISNMSSPGFIARVKLVNSAHSVVKDTVRHSLMQFVHFTPGMASMYSLFRHSLSPFLSLALLPVRSLSSLLGGSLTFFNHYHS